MLNLKIIMLSEVRQTKKDKQHDIAYMWTSWVAQW